MYPYYQGYDPNFSLSIDDIQGIQFLYGKKIISITKPVTTTTTRKTRPTKTTTKLTTTAATRKSTTTFKNPFMYFPPCSYTNNAIFLSKFRFISGQNVSFLTFLKYV
jgi:hypothetical protein